MTAAIFQSRENQLMCPTPNTVIFWCNFKPATNGVVDRAEKALVTLGTSHEWDTVVQAKTAGAAGNLITVSLAADAALTAKATHDFGEECTQLDTIIRFKTAGVAGNAW